LRFVFALCVFLSHYSVNGKVIFEEGYIGVEFFFILSGFIIAYKYGERFLQKRITKKEFYVARLARIYPLHLLTLVLVIMLTGVNVVRHGGVFPWKSLAFNALLLQSFIPVKSVYFSFNAVSWSISNEAFFYAVFPLFIAFFHGPKKHLALTAIAVSVVYVVLLFAVPETWQHALFYINPIVRTIDFCIGIALFYLWKKLQNRKQCNMLAASGIEITALGILAGMVLLSKHIPQVFRYDAYYWIPLSLVIFVFAGFGMWGGAISLLLSWKPLVIAGEVSFAFYMFHTQVIRIMLTLLKYVVPYQIPEVGKFFLVLAVTLAASAASFHWFEKPANKFARKLFDYET